MFVEALVMAACIQGKGGCSESTTAYYQSSGEAKAIVQNIEKVGQKITNNHKWIVYILTPAYAAASGQPANIVLSQGWMLGIDIKKELLMVQWSY